MTGSHIRRSLHVSESQQLVHMGTYRELFFRFRGPMRFARRQVVMLLPSRCRFSATVDFGFDVEQSMFYSTMNKFLTKYTKTIYELLLSQSAL
jgi:hypothetical protein